MILTAKKTLVWFVPEEKKTFALRKWKAFPCLQGVLCQTLSQLERIHPECEKLWWAVCLFASCTVAADGAVSMVLGIAKEHPILDRLFNKSMMVNLFG